MNDEPNTGRVIAAVESRFAREDALRRAELERLIAEGKGNEPGARLRRRHEAPGQEAKVDGKRKRGEPMKCCGSKGQRHKADCQEAGESAAPAKEAKRAPRRREARAGGKLSAMPVEDLVAERERALDRAAECMEELQRRRSLLDEAFGSMWEKPKDDGGDEAEAT